MIEIHGIKNCDTMKKARAFLDQRGLAYVFHDYKAEGIAKEKLHAGSARSAGRSCSTAPARPSRSCPRSDRQDLTEAKP